MLLPELFEISAQLSVADRTRSTSSLSREAATRVAASGTESSKRGLFQAKFDKVLETTLVRCILLYETYIESYMKKDAFRDLDEKQKSEGIMDKVLHDIVLGSVNPKTITSKKCAAILDHGLMRCMKMEDNEIELSQKEYIASLGIISYYRKKQKTEGSILDDPIPEDAILQDLMVSFQENRTGTTAGYIFEMFMMRYFQIDCSERQNDCILGMLGKDSIGDAEWIKLFKDNTLKYYRMDVYHFMSEGKKKTRVGKNGQDIVDDENEKEDSTKINFLSYLERIEEFTDVGYFPPNSAGPDGVIPIVRRSIEELSLSRSEYDKLPKIRLICFQFKFLASSVSTGHPEGMQPLCGSVTEKEMLRAIETTNPDKFYTSKGKKERKEVEICQEIFARNTHSLYQASKYCLRYVVTSGNVAATAIELCTQTKAVILIRADRSISIDPQIKNRLSKFCDQMNKVQIGDDKKSAEESLNTIIGLYSRNDLFDAIDRCQKEIELDYDF